MSTILVTGAAGYIGSHTCLCLLEQNHAVVALDNLCNGHREALCRVERLTAKKLDFYAGDIADQRLLQKIFACHSIDAVIHFAGYKAVGESVANPLRYYRHNVCGSISLLQAMQSAGVMQIIFSSSATVYGNPQQLPLHEDAPLSPINPYGHSKAAVENILKDLCRTKYPWKVAILRYFNPVGAHASGQIGEDPRGVPNNLMPFISQVAAGRRAKLQIFGDDYPTADGTGVRDYLHVMDLAEGHICALKALSTENANTSLIVNLGVGRGYSVREIVATFEQVFDSRIPTEVVARRPGDIAAYFADPRRAQALLKWRAKRDLPTMCADTWRWQRQNPQGYKT